MSVLDMWTICDRCGFQTKRRECKKEATGWVVCRSCNDGKFDLKRHPQNHPAPARAEMRVVPNARPDVVVSLA
jgi:hypothetical protein